MATVSLFPQTNMAAVTSCRKLLNINYIQYGYRSFVLAQKQLQQIYDSPRMIYPISLEDASILPFP